MSAAVQVRVNGRVQGVYYRATTQDEARKLGLAGWVRNNPDGSVELRAEGDRERLERLLEWCRKGPPAARVTEMSVQWVEPENHASFEVRY